MPLPDPLDVRPPRGGALHRARRGVQVAVSALILAAPFIGLCRVDLETESLVLLGIPFSAQEFAPIFGLMLLGMLVVFAGALIHGRLWCGWLCPQTTLSELAATIQRWLLPRRRRTGARRAIAALLVMGVSGIVSASILSYFLTPAQLLNPPPAAIIVWGIVTAVLAVNLLAIRHRFCVGICPYGILQSIVQDPRTLRVIFDEERRDQCFECGACERSCPMGVDPCDTKYDQACIGCGDCVCASIRVKQYQGSLIRYRFDPAGSAWPGWLIRMGIADTKRLSVVVLIAAVAASMAVVLSTRSDLDLRITPRFEQVTEQGDRLANPYTLTVGSRLDHDTTLDVTAAGLEGLAVESVTPLRIVSRQRAQFELAMSAPRRATAAGSHPITVFIQADDGAIVEALETRFFVPTGGTP